MSAERTRVLELVANGKLSVEQANELLAALDEPGPASPSAPRPPRGRGGWPGPEAVEQVAAVEAARSFGRFQDRAERFRVRRPSASPAGGGPATTRDASPYELLVMLGKYGIQPSFVRELNEAGLGDLSIEQVIRLGKYGIRPKDVRGFFEAGLEDLTFEDVIMFGKYGVRPEYVREFVEQGLLGDLQRRARADRRPADRVQEASVERDAGLEDPSPGAQGSEPDEDERA